MRRYIKRIGVGAMGLLFGASIFAAGVWAASSSPTQTHYSVPTQLDLDSFVAGANGSMWFQGGTGNIIGKLSSTGTVLKEFSNPNSNLTLGSPIIKGSDGALWLTGSVIVGNDRDAVLVQVTTDGTMTDFNVPGVVNTNLVGLTSGSDGALWATSSANSGTLYRMTTGGTVTSYPLSLPTGDSVGGMTSGPDGALWLTIQETDTNGNIDGGMIWRVDTTGTVTNQYTLPDTTTAPEQIITGPDGALWFIDAAGGGGSVGRITTAGSVTEYPFPSNIGDPNDLVSVAGKLWFIANGANDATVLENVTTSGTYGTYATTNGDNPGALGAASDGTLWYANASVGGAEQVTNP